MVDSGSRELFAAFRRRIDEKIEADLRREHELSEQLRASLLPLLEREVALARAAGVCKRVWLFGSFAWGAPEPRSDIDLLVEGDDSALARRVEKALGREVHALGLQEAPAELVERALARGVVL
jgi:predicted nucleotidyltransferase